MLETANDNRYRAFLTQKVKSITPAGFDVSESSD